MSTATQRSRPSPADLTGPGRSWYVTGLHRARRATPTANTATPPRPVGAPAHLRLVVPDALCGATLASDAVTEPCLLPRGHDGDCGWARRPRKFEREQRRPVPATIPRDGPAHQRWRDDALCAETDPDAFYPEKGHSTSDAKRVCASCPVASECLTYALEHNERFGVWGGLSERARRRRITAQRA